MNSDLGKYIIIAGMMIIFLGVVIYFFHDKLNWIGRLPGDIRIEKESFKFYFPITTMILFSLVLTVIVQIIRKIFWIACTNDLLCVLSASSGFLRHAFGR